MVYNCALLGNQLNSPQQEGKLDKQIKFIWAGCNANTLINATRGRADLDALIIDISHLEFLSAKLYKELRDMFRLVIFAGSLPSHALEVFRLDADSFILKPLSLTDISLAVHGLLEEVSEGRYSATIIADDIYLRILVVIPKGIN